MEYTAVSAEEFARLEGLDDWTIAGPAIQATFRGATYLVGAEFVPLIAQIAEAAQHHPDIELLYPGRVRVTLTTHATSGLTTLDTDVARSISAAAPGAGVVAEMRGS